ncbi:hypothetical protein [Frigidibacter sp. MR17.24]|uniref:hypothetical protein n=1 Tax=Frigidibacter sp. MR17.24 TaxID=3127345 RepID=UPI003012A312
MTYDRVAIMKAAWVIARRFHGRNSETLPQLLSRALKMVWWDAKQAARIAAQVAAHLAHRAMAAPRAVETIRRDLLAFECKDSLRGSDWQHLDALRAELRSAQLTA